MLYHASKQAGLKELIPNISTHGKKYVYAINSRLTAILFGAPKDDFDIIIDEADGKTIIYECYPNALYKVYFEKSCSLYEVCDDGFLANQTGWEPELVCEHSVTVENEIIIQNIYDEILKSVQNGDCTLFKYSDDEKYINFLRDELSERIVHYGITKEQMQNDQRFILYHNKLLKT